MKEIFSPHIPNYIKELEKFGVGNFSEQETEEKLQIINMELSKRNVLENPFLSVVVPAHKEEGVILATMLSLAKQSYKNVEFIFVVNGEEKNAKTEKMLQRAGFTVIYDEMPNIANARQKGAEQANGEFIINTDADTLHPEDWLKNWAQKIKEKHLIRGASTTRSLSSKFLPNFFIEGFSVTYFIRQKLLGNWALTGVDEANSFVDKNELIRAGGWNPKVRLGEGYDLFKRLPKGDESDTIYFDENLKVYTSGRRYEEQDPVPLFITLIKQAVLRSVFQKEPELTNKDYGDYR